MGRLSGVGRHERRLLTQPQPRHRYARHKQCGSGLLHGAKGTKCLISAVVPGYSTGSEVRESGWSQRQHELPAASDGFYSHMEFDDTCSTGAFS